MSDGSDRQMMALRRVMDEVRGGPPPGLDWSALERRTLDRIDADTLARLRPAPERRGLGVSLTFAVAAAAFLLVVAGQEAPGLSNSSLTAFRAAEVPLDLATLPTVAASPAIEAQRLASAIPAGSRVEAGVTPERFVWPGVAAWELAAGSSAVVERSGTAPLIRLDRGTIHASVVPREDSSGLVEALIIEATGTRVAVHGTRFSVSREGPRVVVDVEEGVVTVGPAGQRGPTMGSLVTGPARAAFSVRDGSLLGVLDRGEPVVHAPASADARGTLDPMPRSPVAPRPDSVSISASQPAKPAAVATAAADALKAPAASPGAAPAPTEPLPLTLDDARRQLVGCLSRPGTESDHALRVMASTDAHVGLDSEGRVSRVRFDPPLRPDLQHCAGLLLGRTLSTAGARPVIEIEYAPR